MFKETQPSDEVAQGVGDKVTLVTSRSSLISVDHGQKMLCGVSGLFKYIFCIRICKILPASWEKNLCTVISNIN